MAGTVHRDPGCGDHEADLSALVDGELAAPEAAAVEARLRSCPACD
ncbi:MAG: zf-HC2 domain-containing protein, partial [Planctomycetaceae bacterium]|nr:zf-HC2 domain-containing protein [Planctomycetaceae bacterium]